MLVEPTVIAAAGSGDPTSRRLTWTRALERCQVFLECHFLTRDDQHVELDRHVLRVPDLDTMRALFQLEALGEAVEVVDDPHVVPVDEHLRVPRFHLETEESCIQV